MPELLVYILDIRLFLSPHLCHLSRVRRTLECLVGHLSRVAAHGHKTGMTARNVAIVWAPNLLRCRELEFGGVAALQGVGVQAVVTEFLVVYYAAIFDKKNPRGKWCTM